MIATLSLLPLLLCICFLIIAFTNYSYVHVQALNLCRKHLLIGQDKIRYQMIKLIKLNPKAKKLRKQHDKALRRLTNSKSPHEFAVNATIYAAVLATQAMFAARQKKHIAIAKAIAVQQKFILRKKLEQLNKDSHIEIADFPFKVEAEQILTLTPDYKEVSNFKAAQAVQASWTMHNYNKKFINKVIQKSEPKAISAHCAATIDNYRGEKWQAILMKKGKL